MRLLKNKNKKEREKRDEDALLDSQTGRSGVSSDTFTGIDERVRCDARGASIRNIERSRERKMLRQPYISFFVVMASLTLTLLLRLFFFDINVVSGLSMYPTLNDKDLLLVEKYDVTDIVRYDIITADVEEKDGKMQTVIKRVYGLPGETVDVYSDGYVYINGQPLPDEYQITAHTAGSSVTASVTLGYGEYFVLGDNREISLDSRYFGPVSRDDIRGIVSCRVKPFESIKKTAVVPNDR